MATPTIALLWYIMWINKCQTDIWIADQTDPILTSSSTKLRFCNNANQMEDTSNDSSIRYGDIQIFEKRLSMEDYIKHQIKFQQNNAIDDPLAVIDIDALVDRYRKWCRLFPNIKAFYAVKCNDDVLMIKILADMGCNFDCSSKEEIKEVLDLNVDPSRIVYAQPCKQMSYITYARKMGVDLMTFDNEDELLKIKKLYPSARLLLRFHPGTTFKVNYDLGKKFGCISRDAEDLLTIAKKNDVQIVGLSFHVGSGCQDANAFRYTIEKAKAVFEMAKHIGHDMKILDIGGGFPGRDSDKVSIEEQAKVINESIEEFFPSETGVEIIAEPGRYFVESTTNIAACVIGRKIVRNSNNDVTDTAIESVTYFINDGVYGSFSWVTFKKETFEVTALSKKNYPVYKSTIWGPTCDSFDCLTTNACLPLLEVGDWMNVSYTGSYSIVRSTKFHRMPHPKCFHVCSRATWSDIQSNGASGSTNNNAI